MRLPTVSVAMDTWWWTGPTKPRASPTSHPKVRNNTALATKWLLTTNTNATPHPKVQHWKYNMVAQYKHHDMYGTYPSHCTYHTYNLSATWIHTTNITSLVINTLVIRISTMASCTLQTALKNSNGTPRPKMQLWGVFLDNIVAN